MVYGRLLFNNIKEYTPKWFKTIPYAQTTKPTFSKNFITKNDYPKELASSTETLLQGLSGWVSETPLDNSPGAGAYLSLASVSHGITPCTIPGSLSTTRTTKMLFFFHLENLCLCIC